MKNMELSNSYVVVETFVTLSTLQHGQDVFRKELLDAFLVAKKYKVEDFRCINNSNERRRVKLDGAIRCLSAFPDEKTLIVKCDENGFIFTLTRERKRQNLLKAGYSEEDAKRMTEND